MNSRRRSVLLILPYAAWTLLFLGAPLAFVLALSFSHRTELGTYETKFDLGAYQQLFDPLYGNILLRTWAMGAGATLLIILISYPIAFYLSRLPKEKRTLWLTLILIPFWTNFLVRTLAFMDFLRWHPLGLEWIYMRKGVLATLAYNYLPFALLPLYSSMTHVEDSVLEAARDLGASKRQVFTRVLWPLTRAGTAAAAVLVFVPILGEFLIPDLVGGGRVFVLGTFLQNQFLTARNWPLGAAAIVLLTVVTLALVFVFGSHIVGDDDEVPA